MNVVDSSVWMSYFANEPLAAAAINAIQDFPRLLVPSVCLLEVFKSAARQRGERSALVAVAHMRNGRVVELDHTLAIAAAVCGLKHGLPLADSVIFATAQHYSAVLWTRDADFRDLPGVKLLV